MPHIEKIELPDGTLADVGLTYKEDTETPIVVNITDTTIDKVEAFDMTFYKVSDTVFTTRQFRNCELSLVSDGSPISATIFSADTISSFTAMYLVDAWSGLQPQLPEGTPLPFSTAMTLPGIAAMFYTEIEDFIFLSFDEPGTFSDSSIIPISITVPSAGTYLATDNSLAQELQLKLVYHNYSCLPAEYIDGGTAYMFRSLAFGALFSMTMEHNMTGTSKCSTEDMEDLVDAITSGRPIIFDGIQMALMSMGTMRQNDPIFVLQGIGVIYGKEIVLQVYVRSTEGTISLSIDEVKTGPVTINVDDSYSWNLMSSWQAAYMASGGTVTSAVLHPENISDFIAEVQEAVENKDPVQIAFNYTDGEYFVTNAVTLMKASDGLIINVGAHFTEYNASLGGMFSIDVLVGNTENCDGVFINATIVPITDTSST